MRPLALVRTMHMLIISSYVSERRTSMKPFLCLAVLLTLAACDVPFVPLI